MTGQRLFFSAFGALPPVGAVSTSPDGSGEKARPRSDKNSTTKYDQTKPCSSSSRPGMASDGHLMLASHHVEDTLVGYTPPVGPPVHQRRMTRLTAGRIRFALFNVSQEWRLNWLAHITDDQPGRGHHFRRGRWRNFDFQRLQFHQPGFQQSFPQPRQPGAHRHEHLQMRYPDGSNKSINPWHPLGHRTSS